jgi:hypothetical protein
VLFRRTDSLDVVLGGGGPGGLRFTAAGLSGAGSPLGLVGSGAWTASLDDLRLRLASFSLDHVFFCAGTMAIGKNKRLGKKKGGKKKP